jgi:predicted polyphosphate/ATP-dependent NAD kinase
MKARGALGIIVNPHSGRDARRLFARAGTSTIDDKRNQVTRIVVGAAAAGCPRVLLSRDSFRIASAATDALDLPIEIELLDLPTTGHARDSESAALAMREAGCGAIVTLGGDGTSRTVVRAWRDVVLLLSRPEPTTSFPSRSRRRWRVPRRDSSPPAGSRGKPPPNGRRSCSSAATTDARAWP